MVIGYLFCILALASQPTGTVPTNLRSLVKVGNLVKMRSSSADSIYGFGVIVRRVQVFPPLFQVHWSRYGLGKQVAEHSLEVISRAAR